MIVRGPAARERLSLETSDPATGPMFTRAGDRALALAHAESPSAGEAAVAALAALILGDLTPATAVLDAWADPDTSDADVQPGGSGFVSLPLLAARHLAWTGDFALARRLWPQVREAHTRAAEFVRGREVGAGLIGVVGGLLRELVPLAEAAGDTGAGAALAADARSLLRDARAAPDPASPEFLIATALGAFDPDPLPVQAVASHPLESALSLWDAAFACVQVWADLAAGHTDAARLWQQLLAYLQKASEIRAGATAAGADPIGEAAVQVIAAGVFGLIGVSPDAPKMRLRLRPHMPAEWATLDVRNVSMSDARFDLRIRREGERRIYTIDQTAGAVPGTVILEMIVPGPSVRKIEVDGRPAGLDLRRFGPGFLIPIQLITDDVRVVTVDGEGY